MTLENKEAWNLFGKPFGFGKKQEAPQATPAAPVSPSKPRRDDTKIPESTGVQKKFWERAKLSPDDDHGIITQMILANPNVLKLYNELEKRAPRAYKIVTKYIDKWNVEADKLQPSGGLTSKEAAEKRAADREAAEKWAAIWDKKEPNEALSELLENFSKKYKVESLAEETAKSFDQLRKNLKSHFDAIAAKKAELTDEESAIVDFYRRLDRMLPDNADIKPQKLKNDVKMLKQELAKMVRDQSALKPASASVIQGPVPSAVPARAPVSKATKTPMVPEWVPKESSDNAVNGTSISYGDIQIVGPMMEVDASTDEIEKLSKLFQK
jgi:hypothetical protein